MRWVLRVLSMMAVATGPGHSTLSATAMLPERTDTWLGIAGGPGGALLSAIAIAMILLYRLDKGTHARILADLNARRAECIASRPMHLNDIVGESPH